MSEQFFIKQPKYLTHTTQPSEQPTASSAAPRPATQPAVQQPSSSSTPPSVQPSLNAQPVAAEHAHAAQPVTFDPRAGEPTVTMRFGPPTGSQQQKYAEQERNTPASQKAAFVVSGVIICAAFVLFAVSIIVPIVVSAFRTFP